MTIIVITLLFYLNFIFKDFIFYINDMIIHIKTGIKIFLILNLINEQCFNILCCGCCPCNKKKSNSTDNSQYIEFGSSKGEDVNVLKGKDINSSKNGQNIESGLNKENKQKKEKFKNTVDNTTIKDSSANFKKNEYKNNIIKNSSKQHPILSNQPPISSNQPSIFSNPIPIPYNQPPKIGLKNVGATCYMNATLQCLSQIYLLKEYFINNQNNQHIYNTIMKYKDKNELCLTESFKILIDNLWPQCYNNNHQKNSNNYYYAPYDFKDRISKMNPLFEGAQANDAKDLVNYIIMTLHEELNIYPKKNNNNAIMDPKLQCNQIFVFNNFMNYFFKENKSIISDIFYGIQHSTTLCSQCKCLKHNYEVYFFLNFPLEEVRKYKLQNLTARNYNIMSQMNMNPNMMMNMNNNMMMNPMMMNQNMMMNPMMMNPMNMNPMMMNLQQEFNINSNKINLLNQNTVDIYDCFEYSQNPQEFTGQNAMYCDNCKNQFPATFTTTLYNAPEVLIIVLNRGTGNQYKTKLKFNFYLDLTNYLDDKNSGYMYELIGLVTHMGESGGSGHFIATCKSPIDKNWYQYNDDLVFPVTNFNQQMLDYATPYILFYKKGGI